MVRAVGGSSTVRRLDDAAAWSAVAQEWSALWRRAAGSPFQHPAWLLPWIEWMRPALRGVAAWRGGELVAFLPFVENKVDGSLELAGDPVSDYLDGLIDPSLPDDGLTTLLATLPDVCGTPSDRRGVRLDWKLLPDHSRLRTVCVEGTWASRQQPDTACPVVRLPKATDALHAHFPKGLAGNIANARQRAEGSGGLQLVFAERHTVDELLDDLFRLHAARWSVEHQPGVLADSRVQAFHRAAARGLFEAGMLRLLAVQVGSDRAAVWYGFSCQGRMAYYIGGYDPRYRALSVGHLAVCAAMEQGVAEGCREFDFLRGQEPYKYAWGATDRWTWRRQLVSAPAPLGGVGRELLPQPWGLSQPARGSDEVAR